MNSWLEFFGLWLADFYLAATILLTMAAILFTMIRQPARRMAVAWGSLLGLLVASGLCLLPSRPRFDLRPFFTRPESRVTQAEPAPVPIASPSVVETAAPQSDEAEELAFDRFEPPPAPVAQSARTDAPPTASAPDEPAVAWIPRLAAVAVWSFLAGSLAMATWLVLGVVRAPSLVRRSTLAPDGCCDELRQIAGPAARLPRLRINPRLAMPVATGTLRPAILLPEGFAEAGSRNALKAVLAHEWTHIKNGDLWLLAIDRLALSLLWAHPLYWWTRRRFRTNQELLADAAAASQIGPTDYAALLVEWARKLASQRGLTALTAVGIWERPAALEERVTEILNQNHETQRCSGRVRAALVGCLAGLTLIATSLSLRPPLAQSAPPLVPLAPIQTLNPLKSSPGEAVLKDDPQSPSAKAEKIVDYHVNKDEIGGLCVEQGEKRVPGIEVSLYLDRFGGPDNPDRSLLDRTTSNAEGQFLFRHVPELRPHAERFLLIARKQGRQTAIEQLNHRHDWIDLGVPPAVPLKGLVKDQHGSPIAGVLVRCDQQGFYGLPETIRSARTNARGEFEIDDVVGVGTCVIEHPQYARRTLFRTKASALAEVRLVKAGVIEGQVLDSGTGQPVGGLLVGMQRINRPYRGDLGDLDDAAFFFARSKTNANGRYRIGEIPAGTFNVYLTSTVPDRASVAIDSLKVAAGQTVQAPPIRLVKGGVVKGRLIDSSTGKPAVVAEDEWVSIGAQGPSRPRSGASIEGTRVREDGSFEIRLPPGKNSVYVSGGPFLVLKPGDPYATQDIREINVKEGQEATVEFRVIRMTPMKRPASSDQSQPQVAPSNRSENDKPRSTMLAEVPKIVDPHFAAGDLGGLCLSADDSPISGVEVSLYIQHTEGESRSHQFVGQTTSSDEGRFVFRHVPPLQPKLERYCFVARREGLAIAMGVLDRQHDWLDLKLRSPVLRKGTVKDEEGKPIADAVVCRYRIEHTYPEGVFATRTNVRGEFEIDEVAGARFWFVNHPDYLSESFKAQNSNEVRLKKGGVLQGRVVNGDTDQPAAGVLIGVEPLGHLEDQVRRGGPRRLLFPPPIMTDANGRYRVRPLPSSKIGLSIRGGPSGLASVGIDAIDVRQGETIQAPVIRLAKGGILSGKLINNLRNDLEWVDEDETISVGVVRGATDAKPVVENVHVRRDGTFHVWLPPGKNSVYLAGGPFFAVGDAAQGIGHDRRELDVQPGREYAVAFQVVRIGRVRDVHGSAVFSAASTTNLVSAAEPSAGAEEQSTAHKAVGRFSGTVRLDAAAKDLDAGTSNPDESLKINRAVDNGIANVFIYLAESPDGRPFAAPQQAFRLRTDGKAFSPRAGIIRVGQELTLHNDGQPFANFHLLPGRNPGINHAVPAGGQANLKARMAVPERTPFEVRSDVHSWMRANLLVLDHPFAAVTDELGAFEIADLPPGKYAFRIWHERAGFLERALPIEIKRGERTKARLSYKLDRFER
jgi:beta-lactamase regulating signal transducer with metallopeptidase domain/protocatechuate 3,4-dioxygenase beta subunit